jgi:hypothetical protein
MLTGTTPFGGGTSMAIFDRHLADVVVPPSLRCPDRTIPSSFERVVLQDLTKTAGARHASAELFAAALERSLSASCDDASCSATTTVFDPEAPTRDWVAPAP